MSSIRKNALASTLSSRQVDERPPQNMGAVLHVRSNEPQISFKEFSRLKEIATPKKNPKRFRSTLSYVFTVVPPRQVTSNYYAKILVDMRGAILTFSKLIQ